MPFVAVISGLPGSGKTTLGWELSRLVHVPFVSRDVIKTGLHVTVESDDLSEFGRFSGRAFEIFYESAATYLRSGVSLVIEAAFHASVSEPELAVLATLGRAVHIEAVTPEAESLRRFRARAEAGERHAAHNDFELADQMESGTKDTSAYRVDLPWPRIAVDASDGWDPGLEVVRDFVPTNRRHPLSPDRTSKLGNIVNGADRVKPQTRTSAHPAIAARTRALGSCLGGTRL